MTDKVREALKPFAALLETESNGYENSSDDTVVRSVGSFGRDYCQITVGDLRRAKAALASLPAPLSEEDPNLSLAVFRRLIEQDRDAAAQKIWSLVADYIERTENRIINAEFETQSVLARLGQQGWQPIETAPKDGTHILLFEGKTRGPFEGWWYTDWPAGEAYWLDEADSNPEPTHWMTLPPPPKP